MMKQIYYSKIRLYQDEIYKSVICKSKEKFQKYNEDFCVDNYLNLGAHVPRHGDGLLQGSWEGSIPFVST
jgi:hypothetical protein